MQTTDIAYTEYQNFDPKAYLAEYYDGIIIDEQWLLEFLVRSLQRVQPVSKALDFGSGPVVSHLFPLAAKVQEIHVAEYLAVNRTEINLWLAQHPEAYDWRLFTQEILRLEGLEPAATAIAQREHLTRERTTQVLPCDVKDADPLGADYREKYPLVTSHFCAEGISLEQSDWCCYMDNIVSLLQPGGQLIISSCGSSVASSSGSYYRSLDQYLPLTNLTPQDILTYFVKNHFIYIDLCVQQLPAPEDQGYDCLVFVSATKQ